MRAAIWCCWCRGSRTACCACRTRPKSLPRPPPQALRWCRHSSQAHTRCGVLRDHVRRRRTMRPRRLTRPIPHPAHRTNAHHCNRGCPPRIAAHADPLAPPERPACGHASVPPLCPPGPADKADRPRPRPWATRHLRRQAPLCNVSRRRSRGPGCPLPPASPLDTLPPRPPPPGRAGALAAWTGTRTSCCCSAATCGRRWAARGSSSWGTPPAARRGLQGEPLPLWHAAMGGCRRRSPPAQLWRMRIGIPQQPPCPPMPRTPDGSDPPQPTCCPAHARRTQCGLRSATGQLKAPRRCWALCCRRRCAGAPVASATESGQVLAPASSSLRRPLTATPPPQPPRAPVPTRRLTLAAASRLPTGSGCLPPTPTSSPSCLQRRRWSATAAAPTSCALRLGRRSVRGAWWRWRRAWGMMTCLACGRRGGHGDGFWGREDPSKACCLPSMNRGPAEQHGPAAGAPTGRGSALHKARCLCTGAACVRSPPALGQPQACLAAPRG